MDAKAIFMNRSAKGQSIAEVPVGLWMLVVVFLIPLWGMAMFGYRVALVNWATRDACYCASVTSTWSGTPATGSSPAVLSMFQAAAGQFNTDMSSYKQNGGDGRDWCHVGTGDTPNFTLDIMEQPLSGAGAGHVVGPGPLPSVDTTNDQYFLRLTTVSNIPPIFGTGWKLFGYTIPMVNEAVPIQMVYQDYVENPQGLTK